MTRLAVFVPTDETLREEIWKGSGVVGSLVGDTGRLRLDYEGNRELYESFDTRVERAADRHLWEGPDGVGYPTSAMAYVDPETVEQVGWWYVEERRLEVTEPDLLRRWRS